jgi:hypothetical protein
MVENTLNIKTTSVNDLILEVSDKMRVRKLEIVEHCIRHSELSANPLILWEPTQGKATREMKFSYIDMLKWDKT